MAARAAGSSASAQQVGLQVGPSAERAARLAREILRFTNDFQLEIPMLSPLPGEHLEVGGFKQVQWLHETS